MIDFKEIPNGETWELFARDFLMERGFYIESSPDRGADAGKDMLVTEHLSGALGTYKFRWLVSCKHNAISGKAVNQDEEKDILERVASFSADGFIGFYSTIPSAAWNTRLTVLMAKGSLKDYRILDHKLIESDLIRIGYSYLLQRYFPNSYRQIKPVNQIFTEYIPLECHICGRDLLHELYKEQYSANVVYVNDRTDLVTVQDIHVVCKGVCDQTLGKYYQVSGRSTSWIDLGDLIIPTGYLRYFMSIMNCTRDGSNIFSDQAYKKLKTLLCAMSQKVLRENTEKEQEQLLTLLTIDSMFL